MFQQHDYGMRKILVISITVLYGPRCEFLSQRTYLLYCISLHIRYYDLIVNYIPHNNKLINLKMNNHTGFDVSIEML